MYYILAGLFIIIWISYLLSYGSKPPKGVERISEEKLIQVLKEGGILLDVRTDEEYIMGHIPNSVNNPMEDGVLTKKLPEDKSKSIVCYCKSGRRASKAEKLLQEKEYQKIYDFGGITRWTGNLVEQ